MQAQITPHHLKYRILGRPEPACRRQLVKLFVKPAGTCLIVNFIEVDPEMLHAGSVVLPIREARQCSQYIR